MGKASQTPMCVEERRLKAPPFHSVVIYDLLHSQKKRALPHKFSLGKKTFLRKVFSPYLPPPLAAPRKRHTI